MRDFLDSLVQRSLGAEQTLRPRIPSRFEPLRAAPLTFDDAIEPPGPGIEDRPSPSAAWTDKQTPLTGHVNPPSSGMADSQIVRDAQSASERNNDSDARLNPFAQQIFPAPGAEPQAPPSAVAPEVTPFDSANDGWLNRRFADLSSQMQQIQREREDYVQPAIADVSESAAPKPRLPAMSFESSQVIHQQQQRATASDVVLPQVPVASIASVTPFLVPIGPKFDQESPRDPLLVRQPMQPIPKVVAEDLPAMSRQSAQAQPTINVTIGRVEVKATRDSAPAARPAKPQSNPSVMSLQDYLQRRAAGGTR